MVKCVPEFEYFTVFLKNKNIISKIRRSKVTDYAALKAVTAFISSVKIQDPPCQRYKPLIVLNAHYSFKIMVEATVLKCSCSMILPFLLFANSVHYIVASVL